ncbi:MAG: T9SS type A sorting domain-containing protein [Fidelibacterota bacterium]
MFKPLNIIEGLNNGSVQATVVPAFSKGTIEKIFDGNPFTEAAIQNNDSLVITLAFDNPVKITKSKIFFWNNGEWSLEVANSEDDLNNRTESYQLLVSDKDYAYFVWDSVSFSPVEIRFIRLTARNLQNNNIYLGEWELYKPFILISLLIFPDPLRLLPGTSLQLKVKTVDDSGNVYPYNLDEVVQWSSGNRSVATVDEFGKIYGVSPGTSLITAHTSSLTGTITASVESDFESTNAPTLSVKVALVLQDPVLASGQLLHQRFGWNNPFTLVNRIIEEFNNVSEGVVRFQIVETLDENVIFTRMDGEFISVDSLVAYYSTPGWKPLVEAFQQGRLEFDYKAMLEYYDLCSKRNSGQIDEVWVYAHPYASMYESRLAGPDAFWWNSPPLTDTDCEKLLSIMGLNYERGVAEALHSFGHRVESAMWHAYGRWDVHAEELNNWEIFTKIDKDVPGEAHVGNIHYPPNGTSDYDYGNKRYVTTYADNWKRYPILLDQKRTINCEEWGCSHLGYLRWWYNHLPRYIGITEGILNNWWHYMVDYEGAVEEAKNLTGIDIKSDYSNLAPGAYFLEQNYPNPFNPLTVISFYLAESQHVTLKIYNILGQEVRTIVDEWKKGGRHEVKFNGSGLASGVYFYKLTAGNFSEKKKFLLLK